MFLMLYFLKIALLIGNQTLLFFLKNNLSHVYAMNSPLAVDPMLKSILASREVNSHHHTI